MPNEKDLQIILNSASLVLPLRAFTCSDARCNDQAHAAIVTIVLLGNDRHLCLTSRVDVAQPAAEFPATATPVINLPVDESASRVAVTLLRLISSEVDACHISNETQLRALVRTVIAAHNAHVRAMR